MQESIVRRIGAHSAPERAGPADLFCARLKLIGPGALAFDAMLFEEFEEALAGQADLLGRAGFVVIAAAKGLMEKTADEFRLGLGRAGLSAAQGDFLRPIGPPQPVAAASRHGQEIGRREPQDAAFLVLWVVAQATSFCFPENNHPEPSGS